MILQNHKKLRRIETHIRDRSKLTREIHVPSPSDKVKPKQNKKTTTSLHGHCIEFVDQTL